jgi:hypothetical protein
MFFGKQDTQTTTGSTWVSAFPDDCNIEASLPSDFYAMEHVEWDNYALVGAPFDLFISPLQTGDPQFFAVKGKKIRLYPVPDEQELFHIFYRSLPADFGTVGTATGSGSMSASSALELDVQRAPVYYAASILAEQNFEPTIADRYYARYRKMMLDYKQNFHNQNPQMFPNVWPPYRTPEVSFDTD